MKKKSNKVKGNKFEEKVIKAINSGAIWFDKGDAKTDDYCIEIKHTDKKSFRVTLKILEKIWEEALDANKLPKLVIGIPRNEKELFILTCNVEVRKKRK